MKNEKTAARRLRNVEMLVRIQLAIIIVLLIGLCAFATNIYNATTLGEAIQAIEVQQ